MKRYLLPLIFTGATLIVTLISIVPKAIAECSFFDTNCWFKTPEVRIFPKILVR